MDLATGAMGSLLPKLRELLKEEYKLQPVVRKTVELLEGQLMGMQAALREVAERPRDQVDMQVRTWADDIRERSYKMEDIVDGLMLSVEGSEPAADGTDSFKGLMKGILFKKVKIRHQIAEAIKGIKEQVDDVAARHVRYGIDQVVTNPVATTDVDPPLLAPYEDHKELVGIKEERDKLIKKLTDVGGDVSKQQLHVLSIVGLGGLGKTTLAKAVYERHKESFGCSVFISVGPNPDVNKVFKDILSEIDKGISVATLNENELIDKLRYLLGNKRYFIIIDDIWDTKSWEMIRYCLVNGNHGSRIIVTTRNLEVAICAGGTVYKLQPLSSDKSEELFYKRLPGGRDNQSAEVSNLLKKCGGVPLAIITVASLLANERVEDWSKVSNSLGFGYADNKCVEMRATLLSGYYDLPYHLKTCLLHLSIFPANYMIRKDTLIWKWIAESFVHERPGIGLFELGERYFNELIIRSMIEPVEIPHTGIVTGCQIHGMVLEMICSLSREENFVTLLDSNEQHTFSLNNAHRLAIQNRADPLPKMDMQGVRSFNAIMCCISTMPSFQVLRVLAMEDCTFMEGCSDSCLEHIGRLVHLRYLGLWNTPISKLPRTIGDLQFMETLDLRQTSIQELPQSVDLLRRLRCLRANGGYIRVPDWMGNLTSLEELSLDDVSESPNFVTELGKLTELRELRIRIRFLDARSKKALVESLCNLQKIQILYLDGASWSDEAGWEGYVPSRRLRQLSLSMKFSRLPAWINPSLLPNLSHLSVDVEAQDLEILGSLPELLSLTMFVPKVSLDITGGGAFPKLRHFYTSGMPRFGVGAMPSLESVNFNVLLSPVEDTKLEFDSLMNLPSLENVRVEILYSGDDTDDDTGDRAKKAEAALKDAVNSHPNRPTIDVSNYQASFDEECSATAEAS